MPGLVIDGKDYLVPGLTILNWKDDPRLESSREDGANRNTKWVRNIIVHTTKGIPGGKLSHVPQKILPGGKDGGKEFAVSKFWSGDPTQSGAHLIIDSDGSIGCIADLYSRAMFHAGNRSLNHTSIGIEIYQLGNGEIYQASLDACVKLVDFLCQHFGIQRQIHWPYRGRPTKRLKAGGSRSVGVFGHRDLTSRRGKGDPGDAIMELLMENGYEAFDLDMDADKKAWKVRQEALGLKPDGIPGPATVEALKKEGYLHGLWTLGKTVKPPKEVPETLDRDLLRLYLTEFDSTEVMGIYGADKTVLASRMRFLHPEAAKAFRKMDADKRVRCSDMLRTPEGSLANRRRKKGRGLRPGYSGHNYGFSIDIDIVWMLKTHGMNKVQLDEWMASYGWYCHNMPGEKRGYEAWHYNYFGDEAPHYLSFRTASKSTWSKPVAQKINEYYGHWWEGADLATVQTALKALKIYNGDVDGQDGPLTKEAVRIFQRAWDLAVDGVAGPMTKRTLMLVAAERVLVDEAC